MAYGPVQININPTDIEYQIDDLRVTLTPDAEKLLQKLFFEGPCEVDHQSIMVIDELVMARCAAYEDFVMFLTELGNRWAIRHGYRYKKNDWLQEKKRVRERELKELYAVLGIDPGGIR